jgi:hypothetical protein
MDLYSTAGMFQCLGQRVLFYRNVVNPPSGANTSAFESGGVTYWALTDPWRNISPNQFYNAREIYFVENYAVGSDTSALNYGYIGMGSQTVFMGNTFGVQHDHSLRVGGLHYGFIAHNHFMGVSGDGIRHAVKIHSGGTLPYSDALINDGDKPGTGWASDTIVLSHNKFGSSNDNNSWTVAICPQNDEYSEGVEKVLVQDNVFIRGRNTNADLVYAARNLTYRRNSTSGPTSSLTKSDLATQVGHEAALPSVWNGPYYSQ